MTNRKCLFPVLFVFLYMNQAVALFIGPTFIPTDRLIANTKAYVQENPNDASGYYTLARIHYIAFVNKIFLSKVPVIEPSSPPRVAPDWMLDNFRDQMRWRHATELVLPKFGYSSPRDIPIADQAEFSNAVAEKEEQLRKNGWQPKGLNDEECVEHAAESLRNFRMAVKLEPKSGLYHLGLASLLEQYVQFLTKVKPEYVPAEFRSIILNRAKDVYYIAYDCSIRDDLKQKHRLDSPFGLRFFVGYEAGKAYIRLAKDDKTFVEDEKEKLLEVENNLKKIEGLPLVEATPIVFSFENKSSLSELLSPDLQVSFDLDGDGKVEKWPWVKPTTGILVWDPGRRETISSGRQLFGSASWWLLYTDGYRALDALDDNRDGSLTGYELFGISVWFDRDSDGKSDSGEIIPIERTPIVSIETRATGKDGRCLMNSRGLILEDCHLLATYDWLASPVR